MIEHRSYNMAKQSLKSKDKSTKILNVVNKYTQTLRSRITRCTRGVRVVLFSGEECDPVTVLV